MNEGKKPSEASVSWLLVVLILGAVIFFGFKFLNQDEEIISDASENLKTAEAVPAAENDIAEEPTTEAPTEPPLIYIEDSDLYSDTVFLMNGDGAELFSLNPDKKMYPASLTKIMTAIIAIENISDLDETVQIPGYIYDYIYNSQASTAGFPAYDTVSYRDLLYGTLLSSGAECCLTFVDNITGTEYSFAQLMNEKAAELGMENTHFANTTGLHDINHYSTARDMAKLLNYALKNDDFREVFTTESYLAKTAQNPSGIKLESTLFAQLETAGVSSGVEIMGGKTGYTDEAGLCLATLSEVNGGEVILVTAGASGNHYTDPYHIEDTVLVYKYLSDNYDPYY